MKIEDCEVGKKLKKIKEIPGCFVKKDEIVKVSEIINKTVFVENKDGKELAINIKNYTPVNKFKVGDEVVWQNDKAKIWGIRYDNEIKEYEYAVVDKNNGRTLLFESELLPLKKPDELEVGDKFKSKNKEFVEVIAKENDIVNTVYYFGKTNCNKISVWNEYDVDKIIYD